MQLEKKQPETEIILENCGRIPARTSALEIEIVYITAVLIIIMSNDSYIINVFEV